MEQRYDTLREFWPYYLSEHLSPVNRALHAIGSLSALVWLGLAIAWLNPWFLIPAALNGYAFAWVGHFVVEKNRPATFKYPLKSFLCDWPLMVLTLTGQIGGHIARLEREGRLPKRVPATPVPQA
jgi:hypothetical protein